MSRWEIALQAVKFVALGISAASGWYATFYDTKDKDTGRLTDAGRVVVGLLAASSLIALISQSLETKNVADKGRQRGPSETRERIRRGKENRRRGKCAATTI